MEERREGVAAWVLSPNRRLLGGFRRSTHGLGKWASPGGHKEEHESIFETASRELLEETGLAITPSSFRLFAVTLDDFSFEKRYKTFHLVAKMKEQGEAKTLEPDKCEGWAWKTWMEVSELGEDLLLPTRNMLKQGPSNELAEVDALCKKAVVIPKDSLGSIEALGLSKSNNLFGMAILEGETLPQDQSIQVISLDEAIKLLSHA